MQMHYAQQQLKPCSPPPIPPAPTPAPRPLPLRAPSYLLPNPNPNPTPTLHLYVALPCPWAHRALLVRALRNLEPLLPVSVAAPGSDGSWGSGIDATAAAVMKPTAGIWSRGRTGPMGDGR
uniref:GST N-terminal domain-containing protein n=1 Tax=Ananas comosus var. bracteatus TaxID=296719 RepID=A0A6V7PK09_ANACO|nr:unnamed protein product [Ananas comosus var. bracteatus]